MGFLDVFRGREPEKAPERTHEISSGEAAAWVDKHFRGEIDNARRESDAILRKLRKQLGQVRDALSALEKSSFSGHGKGYSVANMTKDSYARRSLSVINGIHITPDEAENHTSLSGLRDRLRESMKAIASASPKQGFIVSKFFRDESMKLAGSIKAMNGLINELDGFLEGPGAVRRIEEEVSRFQSSMEETVNSRKQLDEAIKRSNEKANAYEERIKSGEARIREIMESSAWKEAEKEHKNVERMKDEMASIESHVNQSLASAKRPLKKIRHLLDAGERMPENMFREVFLEGREDWLAGLLREAARHAGEGTIALKGKEKEKLDNCLEFIRSDMPDIMKKYRAIEKSLEERGEPRGFAVEKEKQEAERGISETRQKLTDIRREVESVRKERDALEEQAAGLVRRLEATVLETSGKRLKITDI